MIMAEQATTKKVISQLGYESEIYDIYDEKAHERLNNLVIPEAPDLGEYATKTEVDDKIAAIPAPDLTNYYNKTEIDTKFDEVGTGGSITIDAVKQTNIPQDITGLYFIYEEDIPEGSFFFKIISSHNKISIMGKEYDIIPLRYNYIIPDTNTLNNNGNWKPYYYNYKNNLIYWSLSTGFDTSNVTNIASMFNGCSSLTSIDLTSFNTSKVTTMYYMFNGCSGLISLYLTTLNTSNVTDMGYMFNGCSSLQLLDLSSFDTSKVTDMSSMFNSCSSLQSIDLSNFDTSKVTNMNYMFYSCSSLQSIDLSNFDTSKVTNMSSMFNSCSSLQSIDLSNFDTSKVTDMSGMFVSCSSLQSLDLSNFDTSKVTSMNYMFGYSKSNKISYIKCKQAFKDWCIANNNNINLKTNLDDITWDIVG